MRFFQFAVAVAAFAYTYVSAAPIPGGGVEDVDLEARMPGAAVLLKLSLRKQVFKPGDERTMHYSLVYSDPAPGALGTQREMLIDINTAKDNPTRGKMTFVTKDIKTNIPITKDAGIVLTVDIRQHGAFQSTKDATDAVLAVMYAEGRASSIVGAKTLPNGAKDFLNCNDWAFSVFRQLAANQVIEKPEWNTITQWYQKDKETLAYVHKATDDYVTSIAAKYI